KNGMEDDLWRCNLPVGEQTTPDAERFTDRAREVMRLANLQAQLANHHCICTEHVLLGILEEGHGVAANVLKNLCIFLGKIRGDVTKLVERGPSPYPAIRLADLLPESHRVAKLKQEAVEESRSLDHSHVGTEHLLIGLARSEEGIAGHVLSQHGVT